VLQNLSRRGEAAILSTSLGNDVDREIRQTARIRDSWIRRVVAVFLLALPATPHTLRGQDVSAQIQAHTANAEHALRADDLAAAEREYRAILALNPDNSEALTGLGVLLYGSGRAEEASVALNHALKIDPFEKRAELFLGLSAADLRQCDKATPILSRYFASEAAGKLQRLSGLALLACGSSASNVLPALETAAKLKTLYPGDPDVLYQSAELYTRLWNQDAGELIAKHPDSYRVHQLAGEVYEAQGNVNQALLEYKLALEENPRLPQMHFRIGQLYLQQADADADDRAKAEFRAELKVDPQSGVSELAMAGIDHHQHMLNDALAEYQKASRSDPELVEARIGIAQVLLEKHQVQDSVDELRSVISGYPDNASAHYALMLAYRAQGKITEAGQELTIFKKLQQGNDERFQNKLNALLHEKKRSDDTLPKQ
jgi:predicted Zn-dependent protease